MALSIHLPPRNHRVLYGDDVCANVIIAICEESKAENPLQRHRICCVKYRDELQRHLHAWTRRPARTWELQHELASSASAIGAKEQRRFTIGRSRQRSPAVRAAEPPGGSAAGSTGSKTPPSRVGNDPPIEFSRWARGPDRGGKRLDYNGNKSCEKVS